MANFLKDIFGGGDKKQAEVPKRIVAFGASNSSASINQMFAEHAATLLVETHLPTGTVTALDLNDFEMPIYSSDREEASGIPEQAHAFRAAFAEADLAIMSFAEHNGTYSSAFKNVFDWVSRIDRSIFQDTPILLLATSPGGRGAQTVLEFAAASLPRFGADVRGSYSLPNFNDHFDLEAKALTSDEHRGARLAELSKLAEPAAE